MVSRSVQQPQAHVARWRDHRLSHDNPALSGRRLDHHRFSQPLRRQSRAISAESCGSLFRDEACEVRNEACEVRKEKERRRDAGTSFRSGVRMAYAVGGAEVVGAAGVGVGVELDSFTRSFNSLLGLKNGIFFAGTSTRSPVFGLRPTRGLRCRVRKLPKPRISILSPARRERTTLSKIVSTITSLSFRVSSAKRETSSIRSALVITPLRSGGLVRRGRKFRVPPSITFSNFKGFTQVTGRMRGNLTGV